MLLRIGLIKPQLCAARNGAYGLWVDDEYWRVWHFIQPSVIVDPIENIHQARAAGLAFGRFQACLQGVAGFVLQPTIEGFLQLEHYLSAYDAVAAAAPKDMHALIQAHRSLAAQLSTPNAYVHGDCKINNLLFAPDRLQVRAIIDFDTVMYGHWAWDLGDLVRSVCYSRGKADVDYFAACLQGFSQAQTQTNVADSVAAPSYVTLMLGIRFLTDHISGDHYFRVRQPGENLTRAEEQFALFAALQKKRVEFVEAAEAVLLARD